MLSKEHELGGIPTIPSTVVTAPGQHPDKLVPSLTPASLRRQPTVVFQVDLEDQIPNISESRITSFSFSLELDALCITTSAGHLLLLNVETKELEEVSPSLLYIISSIKRFRT